MQRRQTDETTVKQPKQWLDAIDLEMIFVNAIVICVLLLTIVASDILMS